MSFDCRNSQSVPGGRSSFPIPFDKRGTAGTRLPDLTKRRESQASQICVHGGYCSAAPSYVASCEAGDFDGDGLLEYFDYAETSAVSGSRRKDYVPANTNVTLRFFRFAGSAIVWLESISNTNAYAHKGSSTMSGDINGDGRDEFGLQMNRAHPTTPSSAVVPTACGRRSPAFRTSTFVEQDDGEGCADAQHLFDRVQSSVPIGTCRQENRTHARPRRALSAFPVSFSRTARVIRDDGIAQQWYVHHVRADWRAGTSLVRE